jgi:hypothetical protein
MTSRMALCSGSCGRPRPMQQNRVTVDLSVDYCPDCRAGLHQTMPTPQAIIRRLTPCPPVIQQTRRPPQRTAQEPAEMLQRPIPLTPHRGRRLSRPTNPCARRAWRCD